MSDRYPFLDDNWFVEVQRIVAEHANGGLQAPDMVMNLVVTETPFGVDRQFHVGANGGAPLFGLGHREQADVTLTTDYETARELFVAGDQQAGMQAFLSGRVRVMGDVSKLMVAGQGGPPAGGAGLQAAIQAVTEA